VAGVQVDAQLGETGVEQGVVLRGLHSSVSSALAARGLRVRAQWVPYSGISHVWLAADEVRDGDLDLREEVSAVILEDGNVEHHDALHPVAMSGPSAPHPLPASHIPLIMIRHAHALQPPAAVPRRRHLLQIDVPVLARLPLERPLQRVPHVLHLALRARAPAARRRPVRRDHVPVTRDLDQEVLVLPCVQRARAIAPRNERHAEVACWWRLRREDGVSGEAGVGHHGRGVRPAAGRLLPVACGRFATDTAAGRDVRGEFVEGDAEEVLVLCVSYSRLPHLKIPPAKSPSPLEGKLPGAGVNEGAGRGTARDS
jgi:hypothetical protein